MVKGRSERIGWTVAFGIINDHAPVFVMAIGVADKNVEHEISDENVRGRKVRELPWRRKGRANRPKFDEVQRGRQLVLSLPKPQLAIIVLYRGFEQHVCRQEATVHRDELLRDYSGVPAMSGEFVTSARDAHMPQNLATHF